MTDSKPTIKGLTARPVLVPFRRPVQTASFVIPQVPLVLIDVQISDGTVGRSYVMGYAEWVLKPLVACLEAAGAMITGQALAPTDLSALLRQRMLLISANGITGITIGGIDMALWDARAKVNGVPLATLLGAAPKPIQAYNSCGLWIKSPDALADEAAELIEEGNYQALKIRIGRSDPKEDVRAVRIVREAAGPDRKVMSDFNQSQSTAAAIERCILLDGEGLAWFEDPVHHDNYEGHARVRAAVSTPVQTGENLSDAQKLQRAFSIGAMDYVMPDAGFIGGVTGWMQSAAVASVNDIPMSSHLYPEFSRHLLAATPTAHWLEFVDWASPVLAEPARVLDGHVTAPDKPGCGIEWDEAAVAKYLV